MRGQKQSKDELFDTYFEAIEGKMTENQATEGETANNARRHLPNGHSEELTMLTRAIAETEKTHVDRHSTIPGRVANSNPSVTKSEVVRMLGFNRYFSNREVRVNHRILAIKHCPDKWIERRVLTKEDGMETPKSNVSAFDCLK